MTRTLLEEGTTLCPVCDEEKERLSRHWSFCEWPEISDHGHDVLRGILLGGGSLQGNGDAQHLTVKTTNERLARWLFDRLGWIGHSLRRVQLDPPRNTSYHVRSHAHTALTTYRERWYADDGTRCLQSETELTQDSARIWYALAGGIEWTGDYDSQFRLTFSAESDERAGAIQHILTRHGFESQRLDRRVVLYADTAREWLSWTSPPPPGVTYKWCLDKDLYHAAKESPVLDVQTDPMSVFQSLLEFVTESTGEPPSQDFFTTAFSEELAEMIADVLGGGEWDAALRVAGLDVGRGESVRGTDSPDREPTYSDEDCREAVRRAAEELGEPLSSSKYAEWAHGREGAPSQSVIMARFGWQDLCESLGIRSGTDRKAYSDDEKLEAVRQTADERGEPLKSSEYREWARGRESVPALSNIAGPADSAPYDAWEDVVEAAGLEPVQQTRRSWSKDEVDAAIQELAAELGRRPKEREYREWTAGRRRPSIRAVRGTDGHYERWSVAADAALNDR